jgi:cbb3-type cytochrome oxidase maturation protein
MDILYLLIPVSVLLALVVLGVFAWALKSGQFETLDREGERILFDEEQAEKGKSSDTA